MSIILLRKRLGMPGFPFQLASVFVKPKREGSEKRLKDSIPRGLVQQDPGRCGFKNTLS